MQQRPSGSAHSNCGASKRMSVHDAFTKREASTRSVLPMVRTTKSRCLMSGIGGNSLPVSRTQRNAEAAVQGRHEMRESAETTSYLIMEPTEFTTYHLPDLEAQEVKHGYVLNAIARMGGKKLEGVFYWTLGEPGECAIQLGHHSLLLLGELAENQCHTLADLTAHTRYPGLIGPDVTAKWFTDRARELGLQFLDPEALQLYSISDKPNYPG